MKGPPGRFFLGPHGFSAASVLISVFTLLIA